MGVREGAVKELGKKKKKLLVIFRSCLLSIVDFVAAVVVVSLLLCSYVVLVSSRQLTAGRKGSRGKGRGAGGRGCWQFGVSASSA